MADLDKAKQQELNQANEEVLGKTKDEVSEVIVEDVKATVETAVAVSEVVAGIATENPTIIKDGIKRGIKTVEDVAKDEVKATFEALLASSPDEVDYGHDEDTVESRRTHRKGQTKRRHQAERKTMNKGVINQSRREVEERLNSKTYVGPIWGRYQEGIMYLIDSAYSMNTKNTPAQNVADLAQYLLDSGILTKGDWIYASDGEGQSQGYSEAIAVLNDGLRRMNIDEEELRNINKEVDTTGD